MQDTMIRLASDVLATPIGDIFIVCDERALCAVDFRGYDDRMHAILGKRFGDFTLMEHRDPLGMTSLLQRYFAGDLRAIEGAVVDGGGTPYQRRVWEALRTIPPGATRSYGQLAARIGATHARAVGYANSLNPIAIVVPCHRVIGADASLTGYAGGLERKRWLLEHERVHGGGPLTFFDGAT